MENKTHKVAGIFATLQDIQTARDLLIARGMSPDQIKLVVPEDKMVDKKIEPDGDGVAKEVVKDAVIGSVIGGGVGATGAAAMAVAGITIFAATPVLAPLALLGWGAMVGAFIGGGTGAGIQEDQFASMVKDVTNDGKFVLIVHTVTDNEFNLAQSVLTDLTQEKNDVKSV